MTSKTLISVIGPTAIGKTSLAIALANHFTTEILSADSRQFYTEMSIGTAVPSAEELKKAPHHFIHHKSIHAGYSVGGFEKEALKCLANIFAKNDFAIVVGGSGLYTDAVTKGLDEFPKIAPETRVQLQQVFEEQGIAPLQRALKEKDPVYLAKVDIENPHRIIRALEVCITSGKPYSSFLNKGVSKRPFQTLTVGIEAPREIIYERINQRVDLMLKEGLLTEARLLYEHRALNALQTVGYKELFTHFDGTWPLDFAVEEIKKNTRRFAKRQLTWFRKNKNTLWISHDTPIISVIEQLEARIQKNKS